MGVVKIPGWVGVNVSAQFGGCDMTGLAWVVAVGRPG